MLTAAVALLIVVAVSVWLWNELRDKKCCGKCEPDAVSWPPVFEDDPLRPVCLKEE